MKLFNKLFGIDDEINKEIADHKNKIRVFQEANNLKDGDIIIKGQVVSGCNPEEALFLYNKKTAKLKKLDIVWST